MFEHISFSVQLRNYLSSTDILKFSAINQVNPTILTNICVESYDPEYLLITDSYGESTVHPY
jgi:hypothetical protein